MDTQSRVLEVIHRLLVELGSQQALRQLSADSQLERELGLGSLERVELLDRLEKEFSVQLPDKAYLEARTPVELAILLTQAAKRTPVTWQEPPLPGQSPSVGLSVQGMDTSHPSGGSRDRFFDPSKAQTLGEVLLGFANADPERVHIQLYLEDQSTENISYGQLLCGSLEIARGIMERGLVPGNTVAIMLPTCSSFFKAFFGVLFANCIPVPIYPPFRTDRLEEYARRQSKILVNGEVRLLITFRQAEKLARLLQPAIPTLSFVMSLEELVSGHRDETSYSSEGDPMERIRSTSTIDTALIQYTSGSTGEPKGVVLTHANLLANIRAIGAALGVRPADKAVSWLPLYHDMGLIGSWLAALYHGVPIAIMSPLAFLSRPERWLWAIHHHRATISPAPNFAYELCVRRIEDRAIEGLDLSCWRSALNGAEPVSPDTLWRFSERFKHYGFSPEAFLPVYGLAESSVALTIPAPSGLPRIDRIQRELFQSTGRALPSRLDDSSAIRFVSVGSPLPGHEIRIVNEDGQELGDRIQGHIQFRGPSTMQGYFHHPQATLGVFHEGWVKTGDLGYMAYGELFVTGRVKDLIIKAGRNLYPQEIEELTAAVPGVRRGCVAAFGAKDETMGTERLVIVAETRDNEIKRKEQLASAIVSKIDIELGIPPDVVALVPPQTVPKTSSGKIRRDACKAMYLSGKLKEKTSPVWWQVARLTIQSWILRIRQILGRFAAISYGIYCWMILILVGVIGWVVLLPLSSYPQSGISRRVIRRMSRLALMLMGLSPTVKGAEQLAETIRQFKEKRAVFLIASNHASYCDPLIVASVCPAEIGYVAKVEVTSWPLIGSIIRKCGYATVNRNEAAQAALGGEQISLQLKKGIPVHVFPEGTFTPESGLRAFQMGAFKSAVETGSPILPLVLKGTRAVLRDGTLLPRHKPVEVVFGQLIRPQESGWREMVRLRDAVRREILTHCGEQSLDVVLAGPRGELR